MREEIIHFQISFHRVNIPINCHPKTAWRPTSWINFSDACKSLSELEIAPKNKFSFEIVKLFHLVVARSHRFRRKTPPQCPMGNVLFKRRENLVIRLEDYKLWEVYQTCKKNIIIIYAIKSLIIVWLEDWVCGLIIISH